MSLRALIVWGPTLLRWFLRLPLRFRFALVFAVMGVLTRRAGRRIARRVPGRG
jgi:hypothetical protein